MKFQKSKLSAAKDYIWLLNLNRRKNDEKKHWKNTEADENEETVANALELLELCAAKNLTVQEATDSLEAAIRILPLIAKA